MEPEENDGEKEGGRRKGGESNRERRAIQRNPIGLGIMLTGIVCVFVCVCGVCRCVYVCVC